MKRFLFALTILMVFSFGLAQAAQIELTGGYPTTGRFGSPTSDTVAMGQLVTFTFTMNNTSACTLVAFTHGFEVYTKLSAASPATPGYFDAITYDTLTIPGGWMYHPVYNPTGHVDGFYFNPFSIDGLGMDTIGFGATWGSTALGFPVGWSDDMWSIKTKAYTDGDTLCIDSAFYPPGGEWLWSLMPPCDPSSIFPSFGGPYMFHVYNVPNLPPTFINPPVSLTFDHCLPATHDFNATDPDGPPPITFTKVSGPGAVDLNTGVWTYQPTLADVGTSQTLVVRASDGLGAYSDWSVSLNFTNVDPTCVCDPDVPSVAIGGHIEETCTGLKNDCDPIFWSLVGVSPDPAPGTYSLVQVGDNGKLIFDPAMTTPAGLYTFTMEVTDTKGTSQCEKTIEVVTLLKFDVVIENVDNVFPGQFADVCVWVEKGTERIGGFDMLIAYDASVLNFQSAYEGGIYTVCDWEYFTYRFGPFGNCGTGCPSGLLRVVGMAEVNNGPYHPDCFGNDPPLIVPPYSLFCMTFYVTNNYLYDCMFFPIQFFWMDCGDNVLSSKDGDTLWVSKEVFIKGGGPQAPGEEWEWSFGTYVYREITDMYSGFPTYTGVQAECLGQQPKTPMQFINMFGGGIDIVCIDTLDDRGDINLNGVKNEIADAVMFTNYFIYGLGVFKIMPAAQIAATDINADGLTLSVADLVYLVRIIVGDAQAYPKLAPVAANYTNDGGVLTVDAEMGAAYVVVQGDVTPELLADQMEIKYAYDAEANVTRVLVYSLEGHGFNGEFLNANGNVVSIEMGSYEGAVVKLNNIPANFALNQNYPNPFNPATMISFSLPVASDYTLTIYNVTGQQVATFTDQAEAGTVEIEWDASTMASGVYFYKLTAGNFSDTKKMVLLK